jgi:hypothetical protein
MKKLYHLDEEEKNRILNLHESSTRKQYLMNEQTIAGAAYSTATGAAKAAGTALLIPGGFVVAPIAGVVGGIVGLISSISSAMGRDAFISTVTKLCSVGNKPTLGAGALMDIAEKLNGLINTPNLLGGGYATVESRKGIKAALTSIPSIPDLCGVNKEYKNLYGIDLMADLKREIRRDDYYRDTVQVPLTRAIRLSQEATTKAAEAAKQKPAETLVGWENYPCVTSNPNAKKGSLKDGTVAYNINGETYYGGGRKLGVDGKMSSYYCGTDGTIKIGDKPVQNTTSGVVGTGGLVSGMGSVLISPQQVTALRTNAGLTGTGNSLSQQDINDLYNMINKLPNPNK